MQSHAKIIDVTLKSNKLCLSVFEENDLQNIYEGLSNADVIKYYGVSYNSLESAKAQLHWFANLQEQGEGIWWAICSAKDNTFYGAIGFNNFNRQHLKVEIGFWLLPEFWGKGIVSDAIKLVSNYAFNSLKVNRIEAFVESENNNSSKALLKTGFDYEGTMKKCEIKNNEFISISIYAMLK